ncbi:MAG TPA: hypothetical protein VMT93_05665 [Gemmatimonadaceae bacterium]|nr:hypothetical protein [Gemmatimonadaceae bacterium]
MKMPPMPHPLALLVGGIFLAAGLTWIIPAGAYDRRDDPATHHAVVVNGTFHRVEPRPVGPLATLVAIPAGIEKGADIIIFVFLAGGALLVLDRTGVLRTAVDALARMLGRREAMIVPVFCLFFGTMGAIENMQEEIIALIPLLLVVARGVGFDALTAAAMSVGASMVGAAFSPYNPFQAIIAQKLAGLTPGSAGVFRLAMLLLALGTWTAATMRHAIRTRGERRAAPPPPGAGLPRWRARLVGAIALLALAVFIRGVSAWDWGFEEMGALFFGAGVLAGLVGGLGVNGTAEGFADGFNQMAYASLLIGFARVISVVLEQGRVMDTIVYGLFTPLAHLPVAASAAGMVAVQGLIHVAVPSVSGQAALTMPVLVPLSDLLGLSRQVTVLAYQTGAGMCELLTPTNGAMMAVIAAAGVPYGKWMRFAAPVVGILVLGALAFIALALATNLQ